jgi:Zn-dependent protease
MYSILTALALCLSMGFVVLWSVARQLMNRRIRLARVELRPISELPSHYKVTFEEPLERLRELGFRELDCQLSESIFGAAKVPKWSLSCVNEKDRVMASIHASERPELSSYNVTFTSRDAGGAHFLSFQFQAHLHIKGAPKRSFQDTYSTDLSEGLRIHLLSRRDVVPEPIIPDETTRARDSEELIVNYVKFLFDQGWTRRVSSDEYGFKFLPALRLAFQILVGENRAKRYLKRRRRESQSLPPKASPELQLEAYRRFEAMVSEARPVHWTVKFTVFIVSAILFCAVFNLTLAISWTTVLLFAAAILFHELGHLVGMWIFGYRDLQIFFIPAFGAMTSGVETHALPWQRAIVTLLGPMPGLVLSAVLLLTTRPSTESWFFQLLAITLAINYINLLPMLPFDGGVIVETAIARRFPYTSSILTLTGAIVCGAAGIYLREIVLILLAGVFLVAMRGQWILAKAHKSIQTLLSDVPTLDDSALHAIFTELSKPSYSKISFGRRIHFARKLLSEHKSGKPGAILSFVCLALQTVTLALPLLIVVVYLEA